MKTRLFLISVITFLACSLSTGVFLTWWSSDRHVLKAAESSSSFSQDSVIRQRKNITFVLGEDDDTNNPYFEHATSYYHQEVRKGLDTVIVELKSLLEVSEYLAEEQPKNGLPWGKIRLVVHSNEWTGMSVPVAEGAKRTTVVNLQKMMEQGYFKPLPIHIADADTQLELWGCGLGHNSALIEMIGKAFGEATVYSPKHFVQYRKNEWGEMKRYLNRYYFTTYPTGYKPSNARLVNQLEKAYPSVDIDWNVALVTHTGSAENKAYHYSFKIPLVWLVSYADKVSRPRVKTNEQKNDWVNQQSELQAAFERYKLDQDDFTWTVYPKMHTFEDGITEPSIKAIGLCTILCVLEPIGDPESGIGAAFLALEPSLDDEAYFACSK